MVRPRLGPEALPSEPGGARTPIERGAADPVQLAKPSGRLAVREGQDGLGQPQVCARRHSVRECQEQRVLVPFGVVGLRPPDSQRGQCRQRLEPMPACVRAWIAERRAIELPNALRHARTGQADIDDALAGYPEGCQA